MLTSAERSHWETDVVVEDWKAAGLRKPSILRWKVFTIDEQFILNHRGSLSQQDRNKVQTAFKKLFPNWLGE